VPKLSIPSGGSSTTQYSMYALIGIDGVNCASSVFQAGIEMDIKGSQTAYTRKWTAASDTSSVTTNSRIIAFYYFGSVAAGMSGPQISAGDSINVTVTATSKTTGTVLVKNTTKGTSVTQTVTSTTPLCQQDIEWTLQLTGDSISSLPNFTAFKYTNTGATLNSGSSIGGWHLVARIELHYLHIPRLWQRRRVHHGRHHRKDCRLHVADRRQHRDDARLNTMNLVCS
jgi:hypothetical protein